MSDQTSIGKWRNMTSIYLMHEGNILLLYRQGSRVVNDTWIAAAGGHFEENELGDAYACVMRELNEELSLTEEDLEDIQLRYVTLRKVKDEVRQNYYFFAELKSDEIPQLNSNEGILKWFPIDEALLDLSMPFSAKYMMEHYLAVGRYNTALYGGIATETGVVFTEFTEF